MNAPARTLRVLVVAADADLAAELGDALRRRGHDVLVARDAAEALALRAPEALVCDVELPGPSGLELLGAYRERGERPHAVLLTAMPSLADCRRAMRLGAADLVPVPFALDEIVARVEEAPGPAAAPARDSLLRFERAYSADGDGTARAVRDVAAFALRAGVGPTGRARIASACAEILDNACRHGYAAGEPGPLRVTVDADGERLVVAIADDGRGFDAVAAQLESTAAALPGGAPSADRCGGLARAAALAEDLRFERRPRGSEIVLTFEFPPVLFDEDTGIDLSDRDFLDPETTRRVLHAACTGQSADLFGISPALAVCIGRMLAVRTSAQTAQTALWS